MRKFYTCCTFFLLPLFIICLTMDILLREIPNEYSYKSKFMDSNSKSLASNTLDWQCRARFEQTEGTRLPLPPAGAPRPGVRRAPRRASGWEPVGYPSRCGGSLARARFSCIAIRAFCSPIVAGWRWRRFRAC